MGLRERERESIRAFVERAAEDGFLRGKVLDYGCGRQPYRAIVEAAGADYCAYDLASFPGNVSGVDIDECVDDVWAFDAVLCTQVLQYVPLYGPKQDLRALLADIHSALIQRKGHLVLTYPTTWPEVEHEDLVRFTKSGMERLLEEARFALVRHEPRALVAMTEDGEPLYAGYGAIARAR
jgi:hypothetical protein